MTKTVILLQQWHLPATPTNYAIAYAYISKTNKALNTAVDTQLNLGKRLDDFFVNDLHQRYILPAEEFRTGMVDDLGGVVDHVSKNSQTSLTSLHNFMQELDNSSEKISSNNKTLIQQGVDDLKHAIERLRAKQNQLVKHLVNSKQHLRKVQKELKTTQKKLFTDSLTGLFNRKAIDNNIETWFKNDPSKQIAAIVINLDDAEQLQKKFGSLINNVVLAKVAQKVSSYVNNSGLPARTAGDEFIILLPDVEINVAKEIADKILNGVEKLRFKSTKNDINLPQVNVSLAVENMHVKENIDSLLQRARKKIVMGNNIADDLVMC
ncbi:MAG: diguanylate cyclase [Alteromonadaceae bacterium]|nr:diguanylate cyclase [Alteromonadaceae bacterium]